MGTAGQAVQCTHGKRSMGMDMGLVCCGREGVATAGTVDMEMNVAFAAVRMFVDMDAQGDRLPPPHSPIPSSISPTSRSAQDESWSTGSNSRNIKESRPIRSTPIE